MRPDCGPSGKCTKTMLACMHTCFVRFGQRGGQPAGTLGGGEACEPELVDCFTPCTFLLVCCILLNYPLFWCVVHVCRGVVCCVLVRTCSVSHSVRSHKRQSRRHCNTPDRCAINSQALFLGWVGGRRCGKSAGGDICGYAEVVSCSTLNRCTAMGRFAGPPVLMSSSPHVCEIATMQHSNVCSKLPFRGIARKLAMQLSQLLCGYRVCCIIDGVLPSDVLHVHVLLLSGV